MPMLSKFASKSLASASQSEHSIKRKVECTRSCKTAQSALQRNERRGEDGKRIP